MPINVSNHARHLRVCVVDAGRPKADLTLPAAATGRLLAILPDEVGEKLRRRGVDVAAIAAGCAEKGFPPGELFQMIEGSKHVRVWLE